MQAPRLVVMGRVLAPYGVRGWVKVAWYGESPEGLLRQPRWWLASEKAEGGWVEAEVAEAKARGGRLVARLERCESPEAARVFLGRDVALPRDALPRIAANEIYQVDLIGLEVRNLNGERLGTVSEVFSNGAHEVLRVRDGPRERLLPYVAAAVRAVDPMAGRIVVDWGLDW